MKMRVIMVARADCATARTIKPWYLRLSMTMVNIQYNVRMHVWHGVPLRECVLSEFVVESIRVGQNNHVNNADIDVEAADFGNIVC